MPTQQQTRELLFTPLRRRHAERVYCTVRTVHAISTELRNAEDAFRGAGDSGLRAGLCAPTAVPTAVSSAQRISQRGRRRPWTLEPSTADLPTGMSVLKASRDNF